MIFNCRTALYSFFFARMQSGSFFSSIVSGSSVSKAMSSNGKGLLTLHYLKFSERCLVMILIAEQFAH